MSSLRRSFRLIKLGNALGTRHSGRARPPGEPTCRLGLVNAAWLATRGQAPHNPTQRTQGPAGTGGDTRRHSEGRSRELVLGAAAEPREGDSVVGAGGPG